MKRLTLPILALALSTPLAAADLPNASKETLTYRAYIGGLKLGDLDLGISRQGDSYAAGANFRMTAWLRLFLDTDAKASVEGSVQGERAIPRRFSFFVRDRDEKRQTEILFDEAGNASSLSADPPYRKKSYGMTLAEAAGAVDPATAAVLLASARPMPCDLDMDVFDGRKRHQVRLLAELKRDKRGTVTCQGRYNRIAGFKAKHMTPERRSYDFRAEVLEVKPGEWRPLKVWASTDFGDAVIRRIK